MGFIYDVLFLFFKLKLIIKISILYFFNHNDILSYSHRPKRRKYLNNLV